MTDSQDGGKQQSDQVREKVQQAMTTLKQSIETEKQKGRDMAEAEIILAEGQDLLDQSRLKDVVEKIKIPALKSRIIKILAEKLEVEMELDV